MPYPDELDTFTDPVSGQPLNSPSQSGITQKIHSAISAVQTALGLNPEGTEADLVTRVDNGLGLRQVRTYTVSGTFDKADYPWLRAIRVRMVGGGGGSGASVATGAGEASVGQGGSGGGYTEKLISVANLAASETVTVGAGGTATNAGGNSSFGTHCSANGGGGGADSGGAVAFDSAFSNPVDGGTATGGDFNVKGGYSSRAFAQTAARVYPSSGGETHFAPSHIPGVTSNVRAGFNGNIYGGGASGAASAANQAAALGATGANGLVVVELYG